MVRTLIIVASFFTLSSSAYKSIAVKTKWKTSIDHPTRAALCGNDLWVYSRSRATLNKLDARTGQLMLTATASNLEVSALACRGRSLVFGGEGGGRSKLVLFDYLGKKKGEKLLPSGGRIRDLSCTEKLCLLLREGSLLVSTDLVQWNRKVLPAVQNIKNTNFDENLNPFAQWQDFMTLIEGGYTRIITIDENNFFGLDPFRNRVVVQKDKSYMKWGEWGVWEGYLLTPKAIARTAGGRIFLADSALKSVFAFTEDGLYQGILFENNAPIIFDYPFEIIAEPNSVVVTDVMANAVYGFVWSEESMAKDLDVGFLRSNLFRRPEVLKDVNRDRCLKCHDGAISDQWGKYFSGSHPISVKVEVKTKLPLNHGRVDCVSCHDPHHGARDSTEEISLKNFLRAPNQNLCLECHGPNGQKGANHSGKCMDCHSVHHGFTKLLKNHSEQLCIQCHDKQTFKHRPLTLLAHIEVKQKLRLENEKMTCMSCHSPHHKGFQKDRDKRAIQTIQSCQSCHGENSSRLYINFHPSMRKRGLK